MRAANNVNLGRRRQLQRAAAPGAVPWRAHACCSMPAHYSRAGAAVRATHTPQALHQLKPKEALQRTCCERGSQRRRNSRDQLVRYTCCLQGSHLRVHLRSGGSMTTTAALSKVPQVARHHCFPPGLPLQPTGLAASNHPTQNACPTHPAEHAGATAREPDHRAPASRRRHQQRIDLWLPDGRPPAALAHIHSLGCGRCILLHCCCSTQIVVDYHVCSPQQLSGAHLRGMGARRQRPEAWQSN